MDAKIFLPLPNLLSMFHPFLPPHRLPEGTIHGSAWMLEEGNTPILHKDSNPRQRDGQQRIEKTDKQKGRVRGGGRKKKKRYEERPATTPTPSFTPPSACRWNDGNKEGGENRETNRGQRRKNERTGVGAYKTNPRPSQLVIGILSS